MKMTDDLKVYVVKLKSFGFRVFVPTNMQNATWCYFVEGDKIGYLQAPTWSLPSISTVHKPNVTSGTGFKLREVDWQTLTKDVCQMAFAHAPSWADAREVASVQKFASIEELLQKQTPSISYEEV